MKIRYSLKKPGKKRRTFAIIKDVKYADGRREQTQVDDKELDSLNEAVKSKVTSPAVAEILIKEKIITRLKVAAGIKDRVALESLISDDNLDVFRKFWEVEKVRPIKGNKRRRETGTAAAYYDFLRSIRNIEPLSVHVATKADLQAKSDKLKGNRDQRNTSIRVNQLLRFLKRDIQLLVSEKEYKEVSYVTWDELQKIIPHIHSEEVKLLAATLFCTGVRSGEAFAFNDKKVLKPNGGIYVHKQMVKATGEIVGYLKNGNPHTTVILPFGKEEFAQWCDLSLEKKRRIRKDIACQQITRAAKKAFPKDRSKWISPHDLRHSYAIYMLEKGATLSDIAMLLGDDETTVRKYYTGYVLTDRAIDRITLMVKAF